MEERPTSAKKSQNPKRSIPISREVRQRIRDLRINSGLGIQELASRAGRSLTTIKDLEDLRCKKERFDRPVLGAVAKALEIALEDLLEDGDSKIAGQSSGIEFASLLDKCHRVDCSIMPVIRQLNYEPNMAEQAFQDLVQLRLCNEGIEIDEFRRSLFSAQSLGALANTVPKPDLQIEVSDNLDEIRYAYSNEEIRVKNPSLLFDCNCGMWNPGRARCKIHYSKLGHEVTARFRSGLIKLSYRGIGIFFKITRPLWPPALDSLYMIRDLYHQGVLEKPCQRVLDLGSGTGILGIMMGQMNPHILGIHLSDWLLTPMLFGQVNWLANREGREHVEFKGIQGLFSSGLSSGDVPYDVCLCNPPYIPMIEAPSELELFAPVSGTSLLEHVILNCRNMARETYLQFSDLALPEARKAADNAGVNLQAVGKGHWVGFKLGILERFPEYLDVLEERGLKKKYRPGQKYWHRIQLYQLV